MKHDCPYCGAALGWRLVTSKPLPGERKILPQRAVPVCPACKGALATNIHWSEGVLGCAAALLAFLVQQLLSRAVQPGAGFFCAHGRGGGHHGRADGFFPFPLLAALAKVQALRVPVTLPCARLGQRGCSAGPEATKNPAHLSVGGISDSNWPLPRVHQAVVAINLIAINTPTSSHPGCAGLSSHTARRPGSGWSACGPSRASQRCCGRVA